MRLIQFLAQAEPGGLPDDAGSGLIWGIFLAVLVGLYFLVRNTRRRADDEYWARRKREREMRESDPDLKRDDEEA